MLSLRVFKNAVGASTSGCMRSTTARRVVPAAPKRLVPGVKRFYADGAPINATKIKLTLQTPSDSIYTNYECTTVGVPGSVGEFAVSPNTSPLFAELQPGVIRVLGGAEDVKFFVSGGFIASHPDSTVNISVGECVKLDDLDLEAARRIAAASQSKMSSASSEEDKAIAQIGFDTATAMIKAIEAK